MNKIHIVGVGPGTESYVLPAAKNVIKKADCLIGAKRLLALFTELDKERVCLEGHFSDIVPYIKENRDRKKIAVLVSGDPGMYSLLGQLSMSFKKEEYEVVPGISAVQVAFAKIGETWEDTKIVSLHGREIGNLTKEIKGFEKIFFFTDSKSSPEKIAAYLLENGMENARAIVFENLSYPDERMIDADLQNLRNMKGFGLCVMVVKKQTK